MTQIDLFTWVMGLGFTGMFSLMIYLHSCTNRRLDEIGRRLDDIRRDLNDLNMRVSRLEGAFMNKDCCMIKSESQMKKAE